MNPDQYPILIIIIPLLAAMVISLVGSHRDNLSFTLLVASLVASFYATIMVMIEVLTTNQPIHYHIGNWPPPFGIELVIDHLSALVLTLVSGCALLTAIYSFHTVRLENPDRIHHYYTLYNLLVAGLLGMVATGDLFNLFVLLEISALASYALLARGRGYAYYATFKYLIVGTIGASFYLLGVGYIYIKTGSLNMAELAVMLATPELQESQAIRIGFMLMIIGFWIKMAFFPLHGWLSNAYSRAGITTTCLIAPLMTKVAVYVMIRLMFSVFSVNYIFETLAWGQIVVWLACIAIIAGSIMALAQNNLNKMVSYIIVAEVGYMVGGAWLANESGLTGAIYHIMSDGLMTLCLFMAIGAIAFKTGDSSFNAMKNIFKKMPVTGAVFVIGALSVIGIPPTCGFFSKWYLISGGVDGEHWFFVGSLLLSSLIYAILFFRLIEIGYFGKFDQKGQVIDHQPVKVAEVPLAMLLPMTAVAASLIIVGIYTGVIVNNLVRWSIPAV